MRNHVARGPESRTPQKGSSVSTQPVILNRLRSISTAVSPRARRWTLTVVGLAVAAAALAFSARGTDTAGVVAAFAGVSWWWIAAACLANCVLNVAQGWAWKIGISAGGMGDVPARHAIAATWVGKAGNQLLPGKVGEIARVAMIRSHLPAENREITRIAGSLVGQRVVNIVATLMVIAGIALVLPLPVDVPGGRFAPLMAVGAIVVLGLTVAIARPARRGADAASGGRLRTLARLFVGGAGILRPSRGSATVLALHLIAVAGQITMLECLLRGFDVAAPPTAPLLIIALVGIAGAVPGAPGGAGLNQAALVAPLGALYGVSANTALAFAVGLQATIAVVAVAGGLVGMAMHRRVVRNAAIA